MAHKPARDLTPGDHVRTGGGKWTIATVEPGDGPTPSHTLRYSGADTVAWVLVRWHPLRQPGCVYRQPIDADYDVSLLDTCDPDLREPESREQALRSLFGRM